MKSGIASILFLLLSLLLTHQNLYAKQSNETKTILILFGLSPSTPAYKPILDGIRLKLNEAYGENYNLHMEFLETEKYSNDNYPRSRFDLYNEKYKSLNLDLLICIGRNIIKPIKDNADDYLLNLPTITYDLDYSRYGIDSDLELNAKTACIEWKLNIEKTLQKSLDLFPKTNLIYFITGVSPFDKLLLSLSLQAAKKIDAGRNVEAITDLSMDEILGEVRKIPENSLIFIPVFITDSKLVPYYNPEAINLISREASVPVISISDIGIGVGSFGGYVLSFKKAGLFTGKTAVEILNGTNPDAIQVTEADIYEYIYDWKELKRWNLEDSELIPEESTIINETFNPIDKFKWIIGAVFLFLVLQSLLIANLVRLNRNQKTLTKKIIETESKYRGFLHEDRGLRLGQIAASLSHELNQPLTAILSTAQAGINFINSNEANPELLKQILQKIVENDKRTASILGSIRGMLKLENREKETINLNMCVDELIEVYQSEADRQNVMINVKLMDNPINIIADKIQIQQVLLNLITNAAQVMTKHQTQNPRIDITQSINDSNVIISIRDYGNGIDESIKDKIFKPFVTSRVDGSGIGLSICKSIIDDHNGKIWVENKEDGGAKFSFSMKIIKDE